MIAVDTNIIVRLIVADDQAQVARALALAAREPFFVSYSVLAETDWVLRSRYGYDRMRVVAAIGGVAELVDIRYQDAEDVRWALDRYAVAGEFADYLHMAAARDVGRFASFESKLAKRAGPDAPVRVELP